MSADFASPAPLRSGQGPIGYVLKMYPRFSETFIVSEILAREAAGEEIVVYSLRPPVDGRFHRELALVKAPVHYVPRSSSANALWRTWSAVPSDLLPGLREAVPQLLKASADDAEQAVALATLAARHGVRHLHAHFASVATTVAKLAGAIAGLPYSFTAHAKDIFHQDVDPQDLEAKLRDAHHAITISDYNLTHLRERFGDEACRDLRLVRNGLNLERFPLRRPHPRGDVARLLGVGRLVEKKGFGLLIEAAKELATRGIACRVDIVGDGPLRSTLEAAVREHGLEDVVVLHGARTQSEVRELFQEADLFVAPFVVGADGNADGLPTVLLEAMASGLPCVAADVTAVGEVIRDGETGWLVPTGDLPALVEAVTRALGSEADTARIVAEARALVVREYDSAKQAARLCALAAASRRDLR